VNFWQILQQLLNEDEEAPKPFELRLTKRYSKDLEKAKRSSRNWNRDAKQLEDVLGVLKTGRMPMANRPHKLAMGKDVWDIHIGSANSDWILIAQVDKAARIVWLLATGTHAQLDQLLHT
jgi:addiction module RelE/StbE family toxin